MHTQRPRLCAVAGRELAVEHRYAATHQNRSAACDFTVPGQLFTRPTVPPNVDGGALPSCAVVSSSAILSGARCQRAIDGHDIVMRVNMAPTRGFEEDVGRRTSIQVLNSQAVRAVRGALLQDAPGLRWCRSVPSALRDTIYDALCNTSLRLVSYGDHWVPDDNEDRTALCINRLPSCRPGADALFHSNSSKALKLTEGFGAFDGAIPRQLDHAFRLAGHRHSAHCHPGTAASQGQCLPTAGFYAVHLAMTLCGRVSLFGMRGADRPRSASAALATSAFHYYDAPGAATSTEGRRAMNASHHLPTEQNYYRWLERKPLVRICHLPRPPPAPPAPPAPPSPPLAAFDNFKTFVDQPQAHQGPRAGMLSRDPNEYATPSEEYDPLLPEILLQWRPRWLSRWLAEFATAFLLVCLGRGLLIYLCENCQAIYEALTFGCMRWLKPRLPFRIPYTRREYSVELHRVAARGRGMKSGEHDDLGMQLGFGRCGHVFVYSAVYVQQVTADGPLEGRVCVHDELVYLDGERMCSRVSADHVLGRKGKHTCVLLRARADSERRADESVTRVIRMMLALALVWYASVTAAGYLYSWLVERGFISLALPGGPERGWDSHLIIASLGSAARQDLHRAQAGTIGCTAHLLRYDESVAECVDCDGNHARRSYSSPWATWEDWELAARPTTTQFEYHRIYLMIKLRAKLRWLAGRLPSSWLPALSRVEAALSRESHSTDDAHAHADDLQFAPEMRRGNATKGWWCAQQRLLAVLADVLRSAPVLPEFLLLIDDDTFVNVLALRRFLHERTPCARTASNPELAAAPHRRAARLARKPAARTPLRELAPGRPLCLCRTARLAHKSAVASSLCVHSERALYVGDRHLRHLPFVLGGGGHLLSRALLRPLKWRISECLTIAKGAWCEWHSDWILAACLQRLRLLPADNITDGFPRFHQECGVELRERRRHPPCSTPSASCSVPRAGLSPHRRSTSMAAPPTGRLLATKAPARTVPATVPAHPPRTRCDRTWAHYYKERESGRGARLLSSARCPPPIYKDLALDGSNRTQPVSQLVTCHKVRGAEMMTALHRSAC